MNENQMKLYRPERIISLAIILIIFGVLGIIAAFWVETYITLGYYIQNAYLSMFFVLSLFTEGIGRQLGLINLINLINNPSYNLTYIHLAVVAGLIGSVVCIIAAVGLYYMKKWAYFLGVTILVLYVICLRIITWFWLWVW